MMLSDYLSTALLIAGAVFFLAGTLGLLHFPDVYTRLHALTKADNVGLGLVVGYRPAHQFRAVDGDSRFSAGLRAQ